jgi:hypothetical protein
MVPFAEELDADEIHVQAPSAFILLCGGARSKHHGDAPVSLRDAFFKIIDNPVIKNHDVIEAEDVTRSYLFSKRYEDLLMFETDFAQITELILLFCESEGSVAELGAFVMISEAASRLLVVVRDKHWGDDSFIKLGPLAYLERVYGPESVFVIDDDDIGVQGKDLSGVVIATFKDRLQEPLRRRLSQLREPTTFDKNRAGHIIKLIVGLIQEYGALTIRELEYLFDKLNIKKTRSEIESYILCAESAGWILTKKKGIHTYFFARGLRDAADLNFKGPDSPKNKQRRRGSIREHWQKHDTDRYRGIQEASKGGAT